MEKEKLKKLKLEQSAIRLSLLCQKSKLLTFKDAVRKCGGGDAEKNLTLIRVNGKFLEADAWILTANRAYKEQVMTQKKAATQPIFFPVTNQTKANVCKK